MPWVLHTLDPFALQPKTSNGANDKYEPLRRFPFVRATRFIAISQPFDLPELLERPVQ